jgi:hypothetical protein
MSHSRRRVLLCAVAIVLTTATACAAKHDTPLLVGPGENNAWAVEGISRAPGATVSIGSYVALAPGVQKQVVLKSIRLEVADGLEVVGISVNGGDRSWGGIGAEDGYPLPALSDHPMPLPGAVPPSGDSKTRLHGLAITFGLRRSTAGRGYATGFHVEYTVGGRTQQQFFRTGFVVCALADYDPSKTPPPCPSIPNPFKKG